jgi:hypothetical protein
MNRHKLALPIIVSFSIVGQIQPVSPQQAPPLYGGPPPVYANPSRSVGAAPGAQGAQGAPGAEAPGQSAQGEIFVPRLRGGLVPAQCNLLVLYAV